MTGDGGDTSGQGARVWSPIYTGNLRSLLVCFPHHAHPTSGDR